ncbi:TPA: hypothetical protein EYP12_00585 [Candidatus Bipolaricaulota bacterium]|nr:hypothetical protein [Candidatus Bipolaricaulota bacterium]
MEIEGAPRAWNRGDEDRLISGFRLPSTEGRLLGPWEFKHRRNLVLLFLREADSSQRLLQALARRYLNLQALHAAVLVIVGGDEEGARDLHRRFRLELPFPFLLDPEDRVAPLCLGAEASRPALLLLDRYNALWARLEPEPQGEGEPEAEVQEIEDWLEFIELQCPECDVPDRSPSGRLTSLRGGSKAKGEES